MHLLIIGGFLGSGKTTLLLRLARELVASGRKVAILENEVGQVGVDDTFIRDQGLDVREIYSGCVCCSLRLDLITTLLGIEREYRPDWVIVEPSGVASPRKVVEALMGYGGNIESKRVVTLLDATRCNDDKVLALPIVVDGVNAAETVLINKADAVDEQVLTELTGKVKEIRAGIDILPVSAISGDGLGCLSESLLDSEVTNDEAPPMAPKRAEGEQEPTVASVERPVKVKSEMQGRHILRGTVRRIVDALEREECELIGHVKAVIKTSKQGVLMASATDFNGDIGIKGRLGGQDLDGMLVINAIVYGLEKDILQAIVES